MVSLKKHCILQNYGYGTSELVFRDIVNALTVYGYLTAVNGIKSCEKIYYGGLA